MCIAIFPCQSQCIFFLLNFCTLILYVFKKIPAHFVLFILIYNKTTKEIQLPSFHILVGNAPLPDRLFTQIEAK